MSLQSPNLLKCKTKHRQLINETLIPAKNSLIDFLKINQITKVTVKPNNFPTSDHLFQNKLRGIPVVFLWPTKSMVYKASSTTTNHAQIQSL